MESVITGKIKVTAEHKHEDKDGNLISAAKTRQGPFADILAKWDAWRVGYCEAHRRAPLPRCFRLGEFNWTSIITSILLGYKEA